MDDPVRVLAGVPTVPVTALIGRPDRGDFEYVLWVGGRTWVAR
jgi:hypothetical protein